MDAKIPVLFLGTPEFAVPSLEALLRMGYYDIIGVVTQPDKPQGRHHSTPVPSPVKKLALKHGLTVYHSIKDVPQNHGAEVGVLVAYGAILPQSFLDSFPHGVVNLHPSLLPKYRGSSPIQAAILNRDDAIGVTVMKLDNKMDHGPIIAQHEFALTGEETGGAAHDQLALLGGQAIVECLYGYLKENVTLKEQNHEQATYTEKLSKEDGKIDWSQPVEVIEAQVRAMDPWPGAWTIYKGKRLRIIAMNAQGTPTIVQPEGKKKMPYEEFLKGHPEFRVKDCE